jgi:hypothetical protein
MNPNQNSAASQFHELAFGDVERELAVTRSVLEAVPDAHLD